MKASYVAFGGGLDMVSGPTGVAAGRLLADSNFEQVFGRDGYRRIDGYERFDGRPEPHAANYQIVEFSSGTTQPHADDEIYGSTAEGKVLGVELTGGSWAVGDATGRLIYVPVAGAFTPSQPIRIGSPTNPQAAVTISGSYPGHVAATAQHFAWLKSAQSQRRAVIQAVPGSGPIRGIGVYLTDVYAVRDAADGKTATMWRSSPSGWVQVKTGLLPGGRWDLTVANFTGAAGGAALYGVDGRNRPFRYEGTYTQMGPIFGSDADSDSSVAVATGARTFNITTAGARSWHVGDRLLIASASSGARMFGAVTSYSDASLVVNVDQTDGAGTYADWNIAMADARDRPFLLSAHNDHLFLAFQGGQLQTSNLGDPMTYTNTAVLFGVGDDITALLSLKGGLLGIVCRDRIYMLNGYTQADWQLTLHAREIGSVPGCAQENTGNGLLLSTHGLVSLQATQNFGAFEPAIWSRDVASYLESRIGAALASRMVRAKYQMRIYFAGGEVLTACIRSPEAAVLPKDVAFTRADYLREVVCTASGDLHGEDGMFFGTDDGFVMREDVGSSFDGVTIRAWVRLHFNHLKSPTNWKRFYKLVLDVDAADAVPVRFVQSFDLDDGQIVRSIEHMAGTPGKGGSWSQSEWNEFYWSQPGASQIEANVRGIGRNMSLLLSTESEVEQPVTLQGVMVEYNVLGLKR